MSRVLVYVTERASDSENKQLVYSYYEGDILPDRAFKALFYINTVVEPMCY
jgi:hypothetical protein